MRFVDFLKATVLLSAGSATALAAVTVLAAGRTGADRTLVFVLAAWWALAALLGGWLGRRPEVLPPIARLLAGARSTTSLPGQERPGRVLVNRLWPLLLVLVASGALGIVAPQVPAIAAGFAIIWALYWRRQGPAVVAVEQRDGVAFFVERTSPHKPIRLVRTPGFRKLAPPPVLDGSSA